MRADLVPGGYDPFLQGSSSRLHVFLAFPTGVLYDMLLGTTLAPTSQHEQRRVLAAL
jgi:hypothetical protein